MFFYCFVILRVYTWLFIWEDSLRWSNILHFNSFDIVYFTAAYVSDLQYKIYNINETDLNSKYFLAWAIVMSCDLFQRVVIWRNVTWCRIMYCDKLSHDVISCHMIWYAMIWYYMTWSSNLIWYNMLWCDIWQDMIWCDVIWCDIMLYDSIWTDLRLNEAM